VMVMVSPEGAPEARQSSAPCGAAACRLAARAFPACRFRTAALTCHSAACHKSSFLSAAYAHSILDQSASSMSMLDWGCRKGGRVQYARKGGIFLPLTRKNEPHTPAIASLAVRGFASAMGYDARRGDLA
jgi:hypothetical protein